jgi:hypothetical protein
MNIVFLMLFKIKWIETKWSRKLYAIYWYNGIEYRDGLCRSIYVFVLSIYLSIYLCIYMCVYWSLFVFYFRSNTSVPSPPSEINEISSSSNQQTKSGITLNRQTSEELNAQQGKRKFSLSQYKEHKRLRSNELQNSLADTDMRINNMGSSKVKKKTKISNYYSYEF